MLVLSLVFAGCSGSSKGASEVVVSDSDGDGLSDAAEEAGWDIAVDEKGYGLGQLTVRTVTSDPGSSDTDADGLSDFEEYLIGSDPRQADTDHDGIEDLAEWTQWMTNPLSVDSDGDARGPDGSAVPSPLLFDGFELSHLHTSPSLADTDGDGRTDWEERDDPVRSPRVAEVPDILVTFEGDTVVKLNVEYEESVGQTSEYTTTLSQATGTESLSSVTDMWQASVGAEGGYEGNSGKFVVSGGFQWGNSGTHSFQRSSTTTTESARLQGDQLTRTETAADGFISQGLRLKNTGISTYTISSLALTVLQWVPDVTPGKAGDFRAVATLLPQVEGITLAPSEESGLIQVEAQGVNAGLIKQFLAQPSTMESSLAAVEFEDINRVNFDFLTENTFSRTADLVIDFGNGRLERYRVATNVARGPGGGYEGIRLGEVMRDVLRIPYRTVESTARPGVSALSDVRDAIAIPGNGAGSLPRGAWTVLVTTAAQAAADLSFDDIVLKAGQRIVLAYNTDEDQDGLFNRDEALNGSSDQMADSDGDGMRDFFEIRTGWEVGPIMPENTTYGVRPSPIATDSDGDGLTDDQESALRTDPNKTDTDGDGLSDAVEVAKHLPPLVRAPRLYVNQSAGTPGDGTTWATAFTELRDALGDAARRAATPDNADDVSEVWVAAGTYLPTTSSDPTVSFRLLPVVSAFGGFTGNETKRDQRDENTLFNGCVLSGDGRYYHVVSAEGATIDSSSVLDGFLITEGLAGNEGPNPGPLDNLGAGLLVTDGAAPRLSNLLFRLNEAFEGGGGAYVSGGSPSFENCVFVQNQANVFGGGAVRVDDSSVTFLDCRFSDNQGGPGGALYSRQHSDRRVTAERCLFERNRGNGGGAYVAGGSHRFTNCRFIANETFGSGDGGGLFNSQSRVSVVQCVFWKNAATNGSAIAAYRDPSIGLGLPSSTPTETHILNSSFNDNRREGVPSPGLFIASAYPAFSQASIDNSILWGNGADASEESEISSANRYAVAVRTSCIEGLSRYAGLGNIGWDPQLVNSITGNLRLDSSSPCIDVGNGLIDFDPLTPGFQPAPPKDLDGLPRTERGSGGGEAAIDMGAYEFQGHGQ